MIIFKTVKNRLAVQGQDDYIRQGGDQLRGEQQMQDAIRNYEDVDSWKTVIFLYNAALKEVGTKLEILNDEFQHVHKYNPIEHIKTRIKTPESIVKKLKRYGRETSIVNMVKYINDIAGVRLICSFT